ncbi:MAG: sulfotransferase [Candidatus Hodarchaeota archaeon]
MNDPIFIVGNARSGTTLVSRILKNHPAIYILNETHFMEEFSRERKEFDLIKQHDLWKLINQMLTIQRKDYYRKAEYEEYPEDAKKIISLFNQQPKSDFATLNCIFFEYEAKRCGKVRAGDQTPGHIFFVHELLEMYPNAKFIHMIRDPRAILFSQKRRWKVALRWRLPKFEVMRTFLNYHPVTTSLIWKKAIEAGFKAQQNVSKKSMKTLFFERFVENPRRETQEICDFLQIGFFPDMLDVTVEMSSTAIDEGNKGVCKAVSERWANKLSKTEIFVVENLAGNQMLKLGYNPQRLQPNLFKLILYFMIWPLQLATVFILNLNRLGNPINYISKRFFLKSKASLLNLKC